MQYSLLYNLIIPTYVNAVKDKIEKEDEYGNKAELEKLQEQIANLLDDNGKKLLASFALMQGDWKDEIYYFVGISVLNAGVKIGMQLQDAFIVDEQENI